MSYISNIKRFSVILVRPEKSENVGLVARGMAGTGFSDLRLVGSKDVISAAYRSAVHSTGILEAARFFETLEDALSDLDVTFGSTARQYRAFPLINLEEALSEMASYSAQTKIGLVFGNERTGLTSKEIALTNFRFRIPQSGRQPSYNLGVAVTLVLYEISFGRGDRASLRREKPMKHAEQLQAAIQFKDMLDHLGFMRRTNRAFISEKLQDIFLRMTMTPKEKDIILAMFRKACLAIEKNRE